MVSYTAFSPLPLRAVIFLLHYLSAKGYVLKLPEKQLPLPPGYYPASCPSEPGLYLMTNFYHQKIVTRLYILSFYKLSHLSQNQNRPQGFHLLHLQTLCCVQIQKLYRRDLLLYHRHHHLHPSRRQGQQVILHLPV